MQLGTLALILGSVGMATVAQLLLKIGMNDVAIQGAIHSQRWGVGALLVMQNAWIVGGLLLYILGAVVWLLVLARVELSFAYPFVGIGFIVTMVFGWWFMGDALGVQRVVGTLLIATGIVLVARGG